MLSIGLAKFLQGHEYPRRKSIRESDIHVSHADVGDTYTRRAELTPWDI